MSNTGNKQTVGVNLGEPSVLDGLLQDLEHELYRFNDSLDKVVGINGKIEQTNESVAPAENKDNVPFGPGSLYRIHSIIKGLRVNNNVFENEVHKLKNYV